MAELGYLPFDADNHYYEGLDAFTRHLDPKMAPRCVQWCEINGRKHHVVAGTIAHAVVNPTFNPILKAGALHDYFRGNPDKKSMADFMADREPLPDYYTRSQNRVAVLDRQGLSKTWMFPTLGVLYEELLKRDIPALTHQFQAFNRWVEEDWGFAHEDRIFAAPYLPLGDVDWACAELEWAIEKGARIVVVRPAPIWTEHGPRTPGDPMFDPFWARLNESGLTMVVHAGDSGYSSQGYADDRAFSAGLGGGYGKLTIKAFNIERAAYDFLITLIFDRLFERFPNLRVASVENGSEFLDHMFRKLRAQAAKTPTYFKNHPIDTFKEHVWINPFWEDDPYEVVELMGADRVIFGSDWPHIEGMPQPLDYLPEIKNLDDASKRMVLLDNVEYLNKVRPA